MESVFDVSRNDLRRGPSAISEETEQPVPGIIPGRAFFMSANPANRREQHQTRRRCCLLWWMNETPESVQQSQRPGCTAPHGESIGTDHFAARSATTGQQSAEPDDLDVTAHDSPVLRIERAGEPAANARPLNKIVSVGILRGAMRVSSPSAHFFSKHTESSCSMRWLLESRNALSE